MCLPILQDKRGIRFLNEQEISSQLFQQQKRHTGKQTLLLDFNTKNIGNIRNSRQGAHFIMIVEMQK